MAARESGTTRDPVHMSNVRQLEETHDRAVRNCGDFTIGEEEVLKPRVKVY